MKQKVLKPLLLLMISIIMCIIPMLGYYPIAESWFAAICSVKYITFAAWPIMIFTIFNYGGVLAAMKYGTIMITTGLCVGRYREMSSDFNPYISALIATIISVAIEALDWSLNGMLNKELYVLVPIIMLTWSMTIIFSYFVKRIMFFTPKRKVREEDL